MATESNTQPNPVEPKIDTVAIPEKKKSNKAVWIIVGSLIILFLLIPAILLAVGGAVLKNKLSSQKTTDATIAGIVSKATDSKVNVDSATGSVNVKGKNGETMSIGSSQKLPDDFPKNDIPFIQQKAVTFVITSTNEAKKNWSVTTTVDKSFEDTSSYFEGKIKAPDFEEVTTYGSSDAQTYTGKNTKYSVYVTVTRGTSGEPTSVTYIVTQI
jgi:hypothetical protein